MLLGCAHTKPQANADTTAPTAGAVAASSGESRIVKLKNGLTVLIRQDDRVPLVNVRLYVHTGSAFETPKIAGISHLLEHMVFKGTKTRAPGQIAREVESVGGSLNAATSFDYTVYYVEVPDDQWQMGMDVVADMAFNASIDPQELESEKQVVLAELERGEDTPSSRMFKALQSSLWDGTGYQWPIIGYRDTVSSITAEDIHQYIAEHYQPQSMLLCVVGKADPDAVLAEVEKIYGGLENTRPVAPAPTYPVPEKGNGPTISVIPGKWNKVYLSAAFPLPDLKSSKVPGLEVLAHLLGGDETSHFYRKFKYEMRLVDQISVSAMTLERSGMFYVSATLDSDKVEPFWQALNKDFATFDPSKFTEDELKRAKLNMESGLFLTKETLSGLASKLGYFQFFEEGEQSERNYLFQLSQVDGRELKTLWDEFLRPDRLSAAVLVPEGDELQADALTAITEAEWTETATGKAAAAREAGKTPTEIALPGGSKLILLPDATLPYTAMSMYWTGGDTLISKDDQGLSALSARVLTRGTAARSATDIEDFLSDRAALLSGSSGRTTFALNAKYPAKFTGEVLGLITEILTSPAFAEKEVELAKADQIAAVKRSEDRPLGLAFRKLMPFLFANAPYSYMHEGEPERIAEFTADNVRTFWDSQRSAPFVLAVCGEFDAAQIEEFGERIASALHTGGSGFEAIAGKWRNQREEKLTLPGRNQAHLLAVFPAPGKKDLEASARLSVLRAALAGQSGLLFRDLRDKQGLGYTVTAFLWQTTETGFMTFYIGTKPEQVEQAREGFQKTVEMLRSSPLPQDEMTRAKNILAGEYYQDHQTLLSRSREAASLTALGLDRDLDERLVEIAKTLTAEDIRKTAEDYLDWDDAYFMEVTP